MSKGSDTLLVGTSKGLVLLQRRRQTWRQIDFFFIGFPVSAIFHDKRSDEWWVALAHRHWGQKLHCSDDRGQTWHTAQVPVYPEGAMISEGKPATLRKIWVMQEAGPDPEDGIYLGSEPGGLFFSADKGMSWNLNQALWDHPSRSKDWFGAGRDHPFVHSIAIDPRDKRHIYIAVSCAGVFESRDSGASWQVRNEGLRATYLPNPRAEVGHDPHRLLLCDRYPDVLWQQNHCGIYRSVNGGIHWQEVSGPDNFPYYGFALAIDDKDPERAWVIPAQSDEIRVPVDLALCVCETRDGGGVWHAQREGLPAEGSFDIVFRHSFARSESCLAFGSTNGNLYISENNGSNWKLLSSHLPRIEFLQFV